MTLIFNMIDWMRLRNRPSLDVFHGLELKIERPEIEATHCGHKDWPAIDKRNFKILFAGDTARIKNPHDQPIKKIAI